MCVMSFISCQKNIDHVYTMSVPDKQPLPLTAEDDDVLPPLEEDDMEEEGYGEFDAMFDPLQAFGQLFVAQNEHTNTNETLAEILSSIRDILDKGVKVLYKINLNLEKKM